MIEGSCHCGAVRWTVAASPDTVTECNCSLCRRYGALWAYYAPDAVSWPEPRGAMDVYRWARGRLAFHRCVGCGCVTHWRGVHPDVQKTGLNARLLPPDILAAARVRRLDGADSWRYLDD